MKVPEIIERRKVYETKWFSLEQKTIRFEPDNEELYYSIREGNHIAVVAEDDKQNILLIRQYRPAIEDYVIELPGGHVENDNPEQSAHDELIEETGYKANQMKLAGKTIVDSGRNQGYLYCYYGSDLERVGAPSPDIDLLPVTKSEVKEMILNGDLSHSLNLSTVFLAYLKGFLTF
ncbi:NUDIX hydrolase [Thermodesulfobacteriota bacterium]